MNKKNSRHILVVAISVVMLSTAFVSLSIVPSAAQQVKFTVGIVKQFQERFV
jgi:hypothetical protein